MVAGECRACHMQKISAGAELTECLKIEIISALLCLGSSMVEQLTLNQLVCGSSPHRGTIIVPTKDYLEIFLSSIASPSIGVITIGFSGGKH